MGISYEIKGDLLRLLFAGSTETGDILDTLERAFGDPALPRKVRFLMDVSGSTSLQDRPSENIQMLAEYLSRWAERVEWRAAIIVGRPVQYGIVRMAAAYASSSGLDIRPFEKAEEALSWLARPSGSEAT